MQAESLQSEHLGCGLLGLDFGQQGTDLADDVLGGIGHREPGGRRLHLRIADLIADKARIVGTMSMLFLRSMPAPRFSISLTVPASCGIGGVVASAMIGSRQARASNVVRPPSFETITFADCISFSISSE